jgi:predicted dehydrogenase
MTRVSPVRIAVVGGGFWAAANHIPLLYQRDDVQLVSICSQPGPQLDAIASQFGFKVATGNADEALDAGVDAVVVASPNNLHYEHAGMALDRGLHILLEKPIATDGHSARELVERAKVQGVHALVPFGWNYKRFTEAAHDAVSSGVIGNIESFTCQMASPTIDLFEGRGDYGSTLIQGLEARTTAQTWSDRRYGGGYGMGQLSHALGLLFWLVDLDPVEIYGRVRHSGTGVDVVDAAVLTLSNGALGTVAGNANLPSICGFQLDIRLIGDRGVLLLDVERERCEVRLRDGTSTSVPCDEGEGAYECVEPVNRFVDLISGASDKNQSPLLCGARAVEVVAGILQSAELNAPVVLDAGRT